MSDLTTLGILGLIESGLPELVKLAEGFFSWKSKSGAEKKQFVTNGVQTVVTQIDQASGGGQKNTWNKLAPIVSDIVDETANELFPSAPAPAADPVNTQAAQ